MADSCRIDRHQMEIEQVSSHVCVDVLTVVFITTDNTEGRPFPILHRYPSKAAY